MNGKNRNDKTNSLISLAKVIKLAVILVFVAFGFGFLTKGIWSQSERTNKERDQKETSFDSQISNNAQQMIAEGRRIFRFDTFGDEAFWTDKLKLHQAIEGSKLGGVGPGVSPKTALSVGLKVDMDALPESLVQQIKAGKIDLDDPATTLALIKLDAVLGMIRKFQLERKSQISRLELRRLSLECRRRIYAGCRSSARRLGEPRPQFRSDYFAGT